MSAFRRVAAVLAQADRYDWLIGLGLVWAFCVALLAGAVL